MAKLIECSLCDARIKVGADYSQPSLVCPSCGGRIAVPGAASIDDAKAALREEPEEEVLEYDDEAIREDVRPTPRRAPERRETAARREPAARREVESRPRRQPEASRDFEDYDDDDAVGPRSARFLFAALVGGFILALGALMVLGIYFWKGGAQPDQQIAQQQVAPPAMPQPAPQQPAPTTTPDASFANPVPANPVPSNPNVTPEETASVSQPPSNPQPATAPPSVAQTPATIPPVTAQPRQLDQPAVPPVTQPIAPPIVAKPDVPGVMPVGGLRYAWTPGREYPYRLTIEAQVGDVTERTLGLCTYQVTNAPNVVVIQKPQEGSGTAFVVGSDGVLATCAHVVKDAKQIEVTLGTQRYAAQVIGLSPNRDIALIRIAAKDLPTLPLSDSETVQLAQPIRVVGYPLSDVLGRNVKVTSGTVSGLNQDANGKTFQIDASINPGNSGGPVVNEFGEVVAIASAKLTGQVVSAVGFAVPINDAKSLLNLRRSGWGSRACDFG